MSLLAQAVIAAILFAAGLAAGIKWQTGVVAVRDAATVRAVIAQTDARRLDVARAATGHEAFKTRIEVREVEVLKEVERVVQKPVYSNICLDDDGLRILASDIAARGAAGEPAPALPRPPHADPARWRQHAQVEP